jgi:LuxR family maltose regulon positive regulatory protein
MNRSERFACKNGTVTTPAQVLKTTPPRISDRLLNRPRLSLESKQFRTIAVTLVQAPQGYGKTSLMTQWRREHMARGAAVAWVCASADADPQDFLQCLVFAIRTSWCRPEFCTQLVDGGIDPDGGHDRMTALLAEIARTPTDLVLIIDEAERLTAETRAALLFLMRNVLSVPNLRVVVGCRSGFADSVANLTAYGECLLVDTEDIRFRLDETISLMRDRLPGRIDVDACARLHDLTEGWPLGLQVALSYLDRDGSAPTVNTVLARMSSGLDNPIEGILARLSSKDNYFLACVSLLESLHPELARTLTKNEDAANCLARLARDTPIFTRACEKGWYRLHNLARAALHRKLADFSTEEQAALHDRAMRWLANRGRLQTAAHHAFHAGKRDIAYRLLDRSLHQSVMQGQWTIVLNWLNILPQEIVDKLPHIRIAVALVLMLANEGWKAQRMVGGILQQPDISHSLRHECDFVLSLSAYAADDPDLFVKVMEPWVRSPPAHDARLLQSHAPPLNIPTMLDGGRVCSHVPSSESCAKCRPGKAHNPHLCVGRILSGHNYLLEGQVLLAEELVGTAVANVDAEFGRYHPIACMLATVLASALYEQGRLAEASAILANRLDQLKRIGVAEIIMRGYCTAAMIAAADGLEHRALDLLEALDSIGIARRLPRLSIVALTAQMRLHAGHFRKETCSALMQRIDAILACDAIPNGLIWRRCIRIHVDMARTYEAIAAQQWSTVLDHLDRVAARAKALKLGRIQVEAMGLRALALERSGNHGQAQLEEAITLGRAYGLKRFLIDAHPALEEWVRQVTQEVLPEVSQWVERPAKLRASPCAILTPKERQVLELLARNLPTKKIAAALEVQDNTVKWHIKNLFSKLDAGNRQHVVHRAQLLGLLQNAN